MRHVNSARREVREVAIGALAMIALAGILVASNRSGLPAGDGSDGYQVHAVFDRIDGLVRGNPVYLSGIEVGRVAELTLLPDFRARVTLRLDPAIRLPMDTSAAVHTNGLFGSKFISLDPGGDDRKLAHGDRIVFTQDALIVSELLDLIIAEGKAARSEAEKGGRK
jgi:phospholipid/cholesterol/gamma-HCH transport system substrate-binding protein